MFSTAYLVGILSARPPSLFGPEQIFFAYPPGGRNLPEGKRGKKLAGKLLAKSEFYERLMRGEAICISSALMKYFCHNPHCKL
jgi:hypothetical protein